MQTKHYEDTGEINDMMALNKIRYKKWRHQWEGIDSEEASSDFEVLLAEQENMYGDSDEDCVGVADIKRFRHVSGKRSTLAEREDPAQGSGRARAEPNRSRSRLRRRDGKRPREGDRQSRRSSQAQDGSPDLSTSPACTQSSQAARRSKVADGGAKPRGSGSSSGGGMNKDAIAKAVVDAIASPSGKKMPPLIFLQVKDEMKQELQDALASAAGP